MSETQDRKDGLIFIRGYPMTDAPWFRKEIIESVFDYVPHDGDIILACYPKTGSTWLQYIVMQILSKGDKFPSIEDTIFKEVPIMELNGAEVIDALQEPRVYKHHIAYNYMQKNDNAKVIYIYRHPEDTFISYYHFMKNIKESTPRSFEEFFENFLTGYITSGSYFKNVLSYFEHKNDKNLLMVSYEKLKLNSRDEVLRIAKFLGDVYYQAISNDEKVLSKILKQISFDYMKKNLVFTHPGDHMENASSKPKEIPFFRKGTIGDGKRSLTPDQLNRLKDKAVQILKGHEVLEEWFATEASFS